MMMGQDTNFVEAVIEGSQASMARGPDFKKRITTQPVEAVHQGAAVGRRFGEFRSQWPGVRQW